MTGAELFTRCLAAGGIDTVYALPGEETSALMDALGASGIDVVLCRHEQAAAFMASAHGRLTGRPAACLSTLGPGATNLVTGVADAMLDRVPMLAITGQGGRDRIGRDSHQMLDLSRLFEPVTKRSRTVMAADRIPGAVAEALHVATTPRPGAVHLSLPEDVAAGPSSGTPLPSLPPAPATAHPDSIAAIARHLAEARRPFALIGAGVLRDDAVDALRGLLDETGIPAATSFMAKGAIAAEAPCHLGAFGLPATDHVDRAIASADLLLTIGLDPVEYPLTKLTEAGRIPVLSLAETSLPRDAGWHLLAEVTGALAPGLSRLKSALEAQRWSLWPEAVEAREAVRADRAAARQAMSDPAPPPETLVAALNDRADETDLLLSGVGTHKLALARDFSARSPGQIVIGNGLAGMGFALPGAIAAARLFPDRPVTAICGDGDAMMNVQDMETATRLDLGLTLIVWVDGGYGLIEDKQQDDTGSRPDLSFHPMDWSALARAFGWEHVSCETAEQMGEAFSASRHSGRRRIVTVPVTYRGKLA